MSEAAYERATYKDALGNPLRILGLEVCDWAMVASALVIGLLGAIYLSPVFLIIPLFVWLFLAKSRKGNKEPGLLRTKVYKWGLIVPLKMIVPELVTSHYLTPPAGLLCPSRKIVLSAQHLGDERQNSFLKFFLNGRRRVTLEPELASRLPMLQKGKGERA